MLSEKKLKRKLIAFFFKRLPLKWKLWVVENIFSPSYGAEVIVCETEDDLQKAYRIRYQTYLEEGYIEKEDYPTGYITDKYDQHSIVLLLLLKSKAVGTLRLINYSPRGFPTQKIFNLVDFPPEGVDLKKCQEVSKLAVLPEYRKVAFPASLLLLRKAKMIADEMGIKYWLFWTTPYLFENFYCSWIKIEKYEKLQTGPLTEENKKERAIAGKLYFERFKLVPYLVYLEGSY